MAFTVRGDRHSNHEKEGREHEIGHREPGPLRMQQKGKYTKVPQLVGAHREVGDDHADDYDAPHEVETLQAMRRAEAQAKSTYFISTVQAVRPENQIDRRIAARSRARSSASSMRRVTRSCCGTPDRAQSFGYIEIAVKPGSVLISLTRNNPAESRNRSTRANPSHSST